MQQDRYGNWQGPAVGATVSGRLEAIPRNTALILLGIALVAATVLRLPTLGTQSLWRDEIATWQQTRGSFADMIRLTAADNYPPLYNILAWGCLHLFGDNDVAIRLPSAISGLATIGACYALIAKLGGRLAGVIAAFALAISGFHVWYSQEARAYALMTLCAVAFAWAALTYFTAEKRPSPWLMILTGAALLYTHPFGALTWISIDAAAAVVALRVPSGKLRLPRFAVLQLVIALSFAPWAGILLERAQQIHAHGFWIPPPTVRYVLLELWKLPTGSYGVLFVLVGLVCLIAAFVRRRAAANAVEPCLDLVTASLFLVIWLAGPLALALVASVYQPMVLARYLIATLPAWIGIAAIGLAPRADAKLRWIIASLAFTLATATFASRFQGPAPRADWRDADRYIESARTPSDCVLVRPAHDEALVRRYSTAVPACLIVTDGPLDLSQIPSTAHRLFVFASDDAIAAALAAQPKSEWRSAIVNPGDLSVTVLSRGG